MSNAIYMDANATTLPSASALAAMEVALRTAGNPSSVHGFGRATRALVDRARAQVAQLVAAKAENVIFVSSGTEANNLALASGGGRPLIVSGIEHDSVLKPAQLAGARVLQVRRTGQVDLDDLAAALRETGRPAFVSIMLANNETGVIQPVREAADLVHEAGGLLHCDASQAPGRIALDLSALGADLLSLSAHKMGGALGAGALVLKRDIAVNPILLGGGQERFRRAGTENVPAIAGFGAAAEEARTAVHATRLAALRDRLESKLAGVDIAIIGGEAPRLPNTSCIVVAGKSSETLVMALDLAGFAVSAGSACSSGKVRPSHVALAMGYGEEVARSAIRISLGWWNSESEIDLLATRLADFAGRKVHTLPDMQPAA
ncbi:cysteine desulfurase family protein [Dongia deserti]|uniref:cysteine desulfurase family protein n=1 Tax=Dongia deserti TaxID=2268030 RepID=UPI000E64E89F|nr:cysteine desulfurase family protein [Dongia deserti]